ncbi:phosphoribosyl-ATP pyrophosphohydrolase [Cohnella kolymensis]|uniref:Phosphoribosyl-ATP pyrophosphohydrolase n=1 Tax=Cohnella kolymensis TaxID=1590652 RepID=A0ABR5A8K1_9BACL|nr:nucleoside triphosphate pyrophosphohydrolase [Cohnella kolymensis]KIL37311.1 phosphoribosyl-ATP pyrophosphohydrolase [Cohnella kolymensis]
MPIYNKLVRDRIPEIIAQSGKSSSLRTLEQDEYVLELQRKLGEETTEYLAAANDQAALEELADILEVLHSLTESHGFTVEELERVRAAKAEQRGRFNDRMYLVEVHDA